MCEIVFREQMLIKVLLQFVIHHINTYIIGKLEGKTMYDAILLLNTNIRQI